MKSQNKQHTATNDLALSTEDDMTFHDFKNSLLVVSLLMNFFIFTTWLTLQVTDRYNAAVINALLG
jgi:hypothetical protein